MEPVNWIFKSSGVEQFLARPLGSYAVARTALVCCPDRAMCVCALWNRPSVRDVHDLLTMLEVTLHEAFEDGVDLLVDVGAVSSVDPRAFSSLVAGLRERKAKLATHVRRQAIVRQPGFVGSLVAGLHDAVGATCEPRLFGDRACALEWLRRPDAASLAGWLSAAVAMETMTDRERQVIALASRGDTNKLIAYEMGIAASTVSVLLVRVARKLRTTSRAATIEAYLAGEASRRP